MPPFARLSYVTVGEEQAGYLSPDIHDRLGGPSRIRYVAAGAVLVLVAVAVVAMFEMRNQGRSAAAAPAVDSLPADLTKVCSTPTSGFVLFSTSAIRGPADYVGTVLVGSAQVPVMSTYFADGRAGKGVLCVSWTAQAAAQCSPLKAALLARCGALAYLDADDDSGAPFGAVRPGVTRVELTRGTTTEEFALHALDIFQLHPIGGGWHVFNMWAGYLGLDGPLTARAYDSSNRLLDAVRFP